MLGARLLARSIVADIGDSPPRTRLSPAVAMGEALPTATSSTAPSVRRMPARRGVDLGHLWRYNSRCTRVGAEGGHRRWRGADRHDESDRMPTSGVGTQKCLQYAARRGLLAGEAAFSFRIRLPAAEWGPSLQRPICLASVALPSNPMARTTEEPAGDVRAPRHD
jgi:hypothetical protein